MKLIQWIIRIIIVLVFCVIPVITLIFLLPESPKWYAAVLYLILYTYIYMVISSFTINHILEPWGKLMSGIWEITLMSDIKELSLEEIQQYLPDEHPDKI